MTFATPTLSGDKSNGCDRSRKIAHSWSGTPGDQCQLRALLANEGFTVFQEDQGAAARWRARSSLSARTRWRDLEETVNQTSGPTNPNFLIVKLDGIDPDDAFTVVPYTRKDRHSLVSGGSVGDLQNGTFPQVYYKKFAYKSIDFSEFKSTFKNIQGS